MHKLEVLAAVERVQPTDLLSLFETFKSLKLFKPRTSNTYRYKLAKDMLDSLVGEQLLQKNFKRATYQYSLTTKGKRYIDEKLG